MAVRLKLFSLTLTCFLLLQIIPLVFSAENSIVVKSSVDKSKISQDQFLTYKIDISGDFNSDPQIALPDLKKNFDIVSTMQSQSLNVQRKQKTRQLAVVYILAAKATGKFTIAGAAIKVDQASFKTEAIEVEVTAAKGANPKPQKNPPPEEIPPEEELGEGQVIL